MFVMPADRRLASKLVRRTLGIRSLRFARREEVLELTGLSPGSIPPFGSLFELPTYCDSGLAEQDTINFNAGDHSISLQMRFADYQHVEQLNLGEFAE
jgi:Ala-tRNA(Pro) deacylase